MTDLTRGFTCCLTFDLDGLALAFGGPARTTDCHPNPQLISRFEFGMQVGLPRILALLRKYNISGTFFVTGETAATYPDALKQIHQEGHEVGCHGWAHEPPVTLDRCDELKVLQKTTDTIGMVTGVTPKGYRAPAFEPSCHTAELLLENGYIYDSSLMGNDFLPYAVRAGDRWSEDDRVAFGPITELIELPVHWQLDDYPHFEAFDVHGPGNPRLVEQMWTDEFEFAVENCAAGVYTLALHPHVIGRGARMAALERLILHIIEHDAARFCTMFDAADQWRNNRNH
jgi:peptidoglycan/xylan/chitin deacetylase (PgdA/CDA1 family)